MSTFYYLWVERLAQRDMYIEQMAFLAVAIVAVWCAVDVWPPSWQVWIKAAYRVGGLVLFALTVAVAIRAAL